MKKYSLLQIEYQNGVAKIALNRPKTRNALNYTLLQEIVSSVQKADKDGSIRVILIYSLIDGVFCSGADIKERKTMTDNEVLQRRAYARYAYDVLENLNKPFIVAINGKCIGGGCEILGTSDITIASEKATFRYVEVAVGSVGATQRVTRLIGRQRANELLFTGRTIDSTEALSTGLVARVIPDNDFIARVIDIAENIASKPSVTLCLTKKSIQMAAICSPKEGIAFEQMAIDLNISQSDWRKNLEEFRKDIITK